MTEKHKVQPSRIRTRGPLAEKVYAEIKTAIISGRLKFGMWLQEETLTKALDVSRTPVREALTLHGIRKSGRCP
ncbi:MAG: GntR family transcriptional regulator [Desulfofustis sp.]|nr:GntR family transcriptional regulator [Desulfofustis sp.]